LLEPNENLLLKNFTYMVDDFIEKITVRGVLFFSYTINFYTIAKDITIDDKQAV
jgi:hypothetical protein